MWLFLGEWRGLQGSWDLDRFQGPIIPLEHDSGKVKEGSCFVALKGKVRDGHEYISEAIDRGAKYIICEKLPQGYQNRKVQWAICPQGTLKALWELARFRVRWLKQRGCHVFGITGSNGKTSCKQFSFQMGEKIFGRGLVHSNPGSFNNEFGVPFNILSAPMDTRLLICELGMNHRGEIAQLSWLAQPDTVVCTTVGTAHIENLGTQEAIAEAKYEIYDHNPFAVGLYNLSNRWTREMFLKDIRTQKRTFGDSDIPGLKPDVVLTGKQVGYGELEIRGRIGTIPGSQTVALLGEFQSVNLMTSASFYLSRGVAPTEIWEAMKVVSNPWGRGQVLLSKKGYKILFDAYNANPESMEGFIDSIKKLPDFGLVFLILGDMKELGNHSQLAHRNLGVQVAQLLPRLAGVVYVGEYGESFEQGFLAGGGEKKKIDISMIYDEGLASRLKNMISSVQLVALKASRSMKFERIVMDLEPMAFEAYPQ